MDELKKINKSTSIVKISSCLDKICKSITKSRENNVAENSIKEIDFLKLLCKNDQNINLNLLSCQVFVRLVENGVLDVTNVLTSFISMLPNSSSVQKCAIIESIISLLLLNLKRKTAQMKKNEKFECQYGLKTAQHPLITILQSDGINIIDVSNKISGILNHPDLQIEKHSLEYLRPVFLYLFCNPQAQSELIPIWMKLLEKTKHEPKAKDIIDEILSWSKVNSSSTCLLTSILLIETISYYENNENFESTNDFCIFLAYCINQLIQYGLDPCPALQCILRALHSSRDTSKDFYNVLLIILSNTLHIISPIYLSDLLRIFVFCIITENYGNQYILNMLLDGIIQWMAQVSFIMPEGIALAHQLINRISDVAKDPEIINKISTSNYSKSLVRNFSTDIGLAFDLAKLAESFDNDEYKNIYTFVDNLNEKITRSSENTKSYFDRKIHLFLRGLFLSKEPSLDCWFKIYQLILTIIKKNEDIAYDFLMTYIYKLAGETNPEIQLELLRGLPVFAVSKDNIPMILSTLKTLNIGENLIFCMDLYLRLWKQDSRTYPFLLKVISQPAKDFSQSLEYRVAKAYTIREICLERPQQLGKDLVSHLSDILNQCNNPEGDLPTSIALDAIVALCENSTVNITSTWKVLSGKFRHEQRPKSVLSLYNFFSRVPLLQASTAEYAKLVDEALEHLWNIIENSKSSEFIREALKALTHYQVTNLMTIKHIAPKFKQNMEEIIDDHIPGECWVELLQKIHPDCKLDAADLIAQFIHEEINSFRSGIYRIPENRAAPRTLQNLYSKSALRAVVNYLVHQSRFGDRISDPTTVTAALRAISKKFSKPIPPLDWSFLHSYFHINFETRKYCILIAKNQLLAAGTAKRLLETFLIEFEPNCFEEDLLLLFSLLPEISNGVSLNVLKNFSEKIALYCFKESQLTGFIEGCLFEKFLDSVRTILICKNNTPEVTDIFTLIIERYMDSMDLDSRLFERYTEAVAALNINSIDGLTSPTNWWETPLGKLKKATIIRCYLVLYNTELDNPLTWLNVIIDAYINKPKEQLFLFQHLVATFYAFNDLKNSCNWIMEYIGRQIQTILAESPISPEKKGKLSLFLDIFVLAIDVFSGCGVILGLDLMASSRNIRLEIFPESLQVLSDEIFWIDQELKIYELLHYLFKNNSVSDVFSEVFRNAIICSRNKKYFDGKGIWTKYVGMKK